MNIQNDILWKKTKSHDSPSLTPPHPWNGPDNLIRKHKTIILYKKILVSIIYIFKCYFDVKILFLKGLRLSLSPSLYHCFLSCLSLSEFLYLHSCVNVIFPVLMYTHNIYVDNYYDHISYQEFGGSILYKNFL